MFATLNAGVFLSMLAATFCAPASAALKSAQPPGGIASTNGEAVPAPYDGDHMPIGTSITKAAKIVFRVRPVMDGPPESHRIEELDLRNDDWLAPNSIGQLANAFPLCVCRGRAVNKGHGSHLAGMSGV